MEPVDDTVTLETLLGHRRWLAALARELVRGEADVDDALQETWLAALERPPRQAGSVKSWLRRVVRHGVFVRHRRTTRRLARERAVARPEGVAATPDEIVARAELQARMSVLVLSLGEPHRTVLLLRFFEDLSTRDIAARTGVPLETARTRLRRALAHLRGFLDREHDGNRDAWCVALVPLARSAKRPALAGSGAATLGVLTMTGKTALILGMAVIVSAALVAWRGTASDGRTTRTPETEVAENGVHGAAQSERGRRHVDRPAPPGLLATTADEPEPADPEESAPQEAYRLRGRVLGVDSSLPGRAALRIGALRDGLGSIEKPVVATAEQDGTFDVDIEALFADGVQVETLLVAADHPWYLPSLRRVPASVEPGASGVHTFALEITLSPGAVFTGRVVRPNGEALAGASVVAVPFINGQPAKAEDGGAVVTDEAGRFRARGRPADAHLVVAAAEGFAPARIAAAGLPLHETGVGALSLAAGVAISGRMTGVHGGAQLEGGLEAECRVDGEDLDVGTHRVIWIEGDVRPGSTAARFDEDGRYVIRGLVPGQYRLTPEIPGAAFDLEYLLAREVDAPAAGIDFALAGSVLVVEVTRGGAPAVKHRVDLNHDRGSAALWTDAAGRVRQFVKPGARYLVQASQRGHDDAEAWITAPAAGETHVEQLVLRESAPGPQLIVTFDGADVERATFGFWLPSNDTDMRNEARDLRATDGRFVVEGLAPGTWRMLVRPDGAWYGVSSYFRHVTRIIEVPNEGAVEVAVAATVGGRLRVSVVDDDGAAVAAPCVVYDAQGSVVPVTFAMRRGGSMGWSHDSVVRGGTNDVMEPLPAGRYRVVLTLDGGAETALDAEVRPRKLTLVEATLRSR